MTAPQSPDVMPTAAIRRAARDVVDCTVCYGHGRVYVHEPTQARLAVVQPKSWIDSDNWVYLGAATGRTTRAAAKAIRQLLEEQA